MAHADTRRPRPFNPTDQRAAGRRTVFVTGTGSGRNLDDDYATVAYNAATGARLWVQRYNGPGNGNDYADTMAVSRNGTVFVTRPSWGGASSSTTPPSPTKDETQSPMPSAPWCSCHAGRTACGTTGACV